jgi:hypothetical protein
VAGIRARKRSLVASVGAYRLGGQLTTEQAEGFELMYRRSRTQEEQDQVTRALHLFMDGWKDPGKKGLAGGVYAHLARVRAGTDPLAPPPEDEDPPALRAALERARVDVRRRY